MQVSFLLDENIAAPLAGKKYPCGYDYALHYGTIEGETLLRYDNAHEQHKGYERHTPEGIAEIEFPGMAELIRQFESEIEELPP